MKSRFGFILLIILNIAVFGVFIFQYAIADYPLVGHDFRLFISRLLDTHLHYKVNGLSIQWYTPSFGGGLPAYANPLQAQFSIPQLLTWFIDPWKAVLVSSVLYALLGFLAVFFCLKDALDFHPLASVLGSLFFIVNGFFIERVVIGHVNFIAFPLIAVFILAFLHPKLPAWLAGSLISLTSAVLIYSGGVYIGVIGLFSTFIILPLIYFIKPSILSWRRLLSVLLWGGVLTMLICGSKLYATSVFMANFPRAVRDEYSVGWMTAMGGLIFQMIGVMATTPFLVGLGKSAMVIVARLSAWTGTPYGFWELDASLSPALLLLLCIGAWSKLKHRPSWQVSLKKLIAAGCLLLAIVVVVQFSIAKGQIFQILRTLPVLLSLHANTRFTAAFILPLAILGAKVFNNWVSCQTRPGRSLLAFLLLDGFTIAAAWAYFLIPNTVQQRFFDMSYLISTYHQIQAGDTMPVGQIIPEMNDYEVFLAGASNTTRHYEPLFRDNNSAFHPEVHEGSVYDLNEGYFNMTNPTGYLFPDENDSRLYERFRVSDRDQMVDFLNRRQSSWIIPLCQKVLDWAAFLTFMGVSFALGLYSASRVRAYLYQRIT